MIGDSNALKGSNNQICGDSNFVEGSNNLVLTDLSGFDFF